MHKEIPLPNLRKSTVRMYLSRTVDLLFITKFRTPGGKTRDPRNRLCRKTRGTPQLYVSYWTLDARYAVGKLDRCRGWVGIEVVPEWRVIPLVGEMSAAQKGKKLHL